MHRCQTSRLRWPLLPLAVLLLAAAPVRALEPVALRCEFGVNPAGVDVPAPRLSWKLADTTPAARQSAFQILVASSPERLARDEGDWWDTGKVSSDETLHHAYAGRPLTASQTVFWKARVWDATDTAGPWSAPATWTMGLLQTNDWRGQWICAPAVSEALLLRQEFTVRPGLRRAVAHVSGLGSFEFFLNGAKVGDHLLAPGWTDYDDTILYETHDVTAHLRSGPNAIGLALGNGMYHVQRRHRFAKFTGSFGPLRAIAHLRLEYADGAVEFVGTDETWRTHPGPVTYNSIYGGEDFDARQEPAGWNRPGFDDRPWLRAVAVVRPAGVLRGHTHATEPIRAQELRLPVATNQAGDTVVYDLGQNASFLPRLRVSGPPGSRVRLTPAEVVNADGSIQRSTMGSTNRGLSWWEYTLGKAARGNETIETWFPQFYYVGCRYLEARLEPHASGGDRPRIESLEGVVVRSDARPVGEFACSDPLLNAIHRLVRHAQRANLVSVLTDCPHREKLGWLEQLHLNGPAIRYEFDLARQFTKAMNDMADAQDADGLVPNIAPEYTRFAGPFRAAAEWGAAFIQVPWQQYQFHADTDLLRRHYPAMKRYFAWLEARATNDLVSDGLGDWYDLGPRALSRAELTPPPVTATAFYLLNARTLAQIADVLGQPDDARVFAAKAERIRASYNAAFFNATNRTYATGSQCANALALALDIVEPAHRPAVLAALVREVEERDYLMTAGDVGFRFLLRALTDGGRADVVHRIVTRTNGPGYAHMLAQGATTLTEAWDARRTASHNHFMLGHVNEWFYRDLAGIDGDPAGPGFKRIVIHPQPVGGLTWVRASYDSARGQIVSHWWRDKERFRLVVTIPPNTSATVRLPGAPVTLPAAARALGQTGGRPAFEIPAGTHEFTARLP